PCATAGRPRRTPLETPDFRTQNRAATAPRPQLKQMPCSIIRLALEGGPGMSIILEEDEYFTSISGYFHALSNYQRHAIVMSLTLETNKG
ncbi:unnamed protein product, partial [Musa hybrid cultivar]